MSQADERPPAQEETRTVDAIDADIDAFMKRRKKALADLQKLGSRDSQEKKRGLIEHIDHIHEELLRLVEERIQVLGDVDVTTSSSPRLLGVTDEGISEVYATLKKRKTEKKKKAAGSSEFQFLAKEIGVLQNRLRDYLDERVRVQKTEEYATAVGNLFGSPPPVSSSFAVFDNPFSAGVPYGTTPANTPVTAPGFGTSWTSQPRFAPFGAFPANSSQGLFGGAFSHSQGQAMFGAFSPQGLTGTGAVPFRPTAKSDGTTMGPSVTFQSVTNMPEYEQTGKSFEELRYEDYLQDNRGSQSGGFGSSFGTAAPASQSHSGFGGSRLFPDPPPSSSQVAQGGLFGFPAPSAASAAASGLGATGGSTGGWGVFGVQANDGTWKCESCLVRNAASTRTCAACETPKPGLAESSDRGATATSAGGSIGSGGFSFSGGSAPAPGGFAFIDPDPSPSSASPAATATTTSSSTSTSFSFSGGSPSLAQALEATTPSGTAKSNLPGSLKFRPSLFQDEAQEFARSNSGFSFAGEPPRSRVRFSLGANHPGQESQRTPGGGATRDDVASPRSDQAVGSVGSTSTTRFSVGSMSGTESPDRTPQSSNKAKRRTRSSSRM